MKIRKIEISIIVAVMALVFAVSCDNGSTSTPQEHSGIINAFGKEIIVTGDISQINKLQTIFADLDTIITTGPARDKFISMLNRNNFVIIIEAGNDGPNANASKSMTIGADYLSANEPLTIETDIYHKVDMDDAFAKAIIRETIHLVMGGNFAYKGARVHCT